MSWFRAYGRRWAGLALFALLLQLVLSFGHVHGLAEELSAAQAQPALAAGQSSPAPHPDSGDHDNDYCAICAVMAMLSGAQVADAPAIALPAKQAAAEQPLPSNPSVTEPARAAFRSRAPPQA